MRIAPIICIEGPSASGKTSLAAALARDADAAVVPELYTSDAPPIPESASWYVERSVKRWQDASELSATAPLVVLDGDPMKGLWYNWIYADEGWPQIEAVAPLYAECITNGALSFPDLYVLLSAGETQLRGRRESDSTRRRSNFEKHLRLIDPQRHFFGAISIADATRVLLLDTTEREALVASVLTAIERLPAQQPDSARLLEQVVHWLRSDAADHSTLSVD